MFKKKGRTSAYLLLCAGLFLTTTAAAAARDDHEHMEHKHMHEHAVPAGSKVDGNPLIVEMRSLDEVFREVVSAVSLGDGRRVDHALHSMHGTMEKTHEGVRHGTVKIPKNADKLDTFVKMDKDFHGELEKLASAVEKNDQQAMLSLTKGLLDGCVRCHGMFR
jgi:hypothetical protein